MGIVMIHKIPHLEVRELIIIHVHSYGEEETRVSSVHQLVVHELAQHPQAVPRVGGVIRLLPTRRSNVLEKGQKCTNTIKRPLYSSRSKAHLDKASVLAIA